MKRIPPDLLRRMADGLATDDRDEMAIPSYLHPNPVMRWLSWRRLEMIARSLERTCAGRRDAERPVVMDFGCGTGVLFHETGRHARRIYGVDLVLHAARLLVAEWKLDNVELMSPERAATEIPENAVDIILAAEVLEHIDPLEPTLEFFKKSLGPGGKLLVSVPTESALYRLGRRLAGFHGAYHHSRASVIHAEIVRAGFRPGGIEKIPAPGPFAIYWVVDYSAPGDAL